LAFDIFKALGQIRELTKSSLKARDDLGHWLNVDAVDVCTEAGGLENHHAATHEGIEY
jgi:hypothetical protein